MNINIFGTDVGILATALPGVTVSITGAQTWSGTTNAQGYAKNANGSPSLIYGDYSVTASLTGYTPATANFTVPGTTSVPLTLVRIMTTVDIIVSE